MSAQSELFGYQGRRVKIRARRCGSVAEHRTKVDAILRMFTPVSHSRRLEAPVTNERARETANDEE